MQRRPQVMQSSCAGAASVSFEITHERHAPSYIEREVPRFEGGTGFLLINYRERDVKFTLAQSSWIIEFYAALLIWADAPEGASAFPALREGSIMNSTRADSIGFYVAVALVNLTFLAVLAVIASDPIIHILSAI